MTPERIAEIKDLLKYESSIAFYSHRAKESMLLLVAEAEEAARLRFRLAELGDQGPDDRETVAEAAQMYRSLRAVIERTMTEPDRWDGDEDESFHLGRYVEWLAAERDRVRGEVLVEAADKLDRIGHAAAAYILRDDAEGGAR